MPLNLEIGPHRRYVWARSELATFKRIKDALGGTVNDVVLAVVTGALRNWLHAEGSVPRGWSCGHWCRSRSAARTSGATSATGSR